MKQDGVRSAARLLKRQVSVLSARTRGMMFHEIFVG